MNYSNLYDMIQLLEKGTKLHIGVIFFGHYGNEKLVLPKKHQTHNSSPICSKMKDINFKKCYKCRCIAINKAIKTKQASGGLCINGIYEYTHPVFDNNNPIAIIFIGNILPPETKRLTKTIGEENFLLNTLESEYNLEDCKRLGNLIESYIRLIIKEYPLTSDSKFNPIIENLKSHIEASIEFETSLSELAKTFNYNQKYLGRLFKSKTGKSFNDYVAERRIAHAKLLLRDGEESIVDVANKVGFNSASYFNRVFKSLCGVTPSEFKRNVKLTQVK